MKRKVVVTGIGLSTGLGHGVDNCWNKLMLGESSVKLIDRYDTDSMKTKIASFNPGNTAIGNSRDILEFLLDTVINEAVEPSDYGFDRLYYSLPNGVYEWESRLSKSIVELHGNDDYKKYFFESRLAQSLMNRYDVKSIPTLISTACASSASTIEIAFNAISLGLADRILIAASDSSLSREPIIRFSNIAALSTKNENPKTASKPFSSTRDGFVMGEGAGAMILESEESAEKNNRPILAVLNGCGSTTDNTHRTRSDPGGEKMLEAIKKAIDSSNIPLADITYVNAHGTSTPENDKLEAKVLSEIFKSRQVKVTSIKSMIGHCLNASGIIQNVVGVYSLIKDAIPPTINYNGNCEYENIQLVTKGEKSIVNSFVSNSFGFGGQNVSIVFSKYAV